MSDSMATAIGFIGIAWAVVAWFALKWYFGK